MTRLHGIARARSPAEHPLQTETVTARDLRDDSAFGQALGYDRRLSRAHGRTIAVTRNQAYERAAKRSDVTFITIKDYRRFRDVGLLGLDVDGNERVGALDRNGSRNALFADLLITTGAPS
jgi:hypothetical protein